VTTEAIAGRAGASKATVYRWWPNKAAVVIEAVAPELPFRDTGSLREDLTTQARNFAQVLSGRGGRMPRSFIIAARADPDVAQALRSMLSDPRRAEAKAMLRRKKANGQLRKEAERVPISDKWRVIP
jgi:AcrR family transcriptional regulator